MLFCAKAFRNRWERLDHGQEAATRRRDGLTCDAIGEQLASWCGSLFAAGSDGDISNYRRQTRVLQGLRNYCELLENESCRVATASPTLERIHFHLRRNWVAQIVAR